MSKQELVVPGLSSIISTEATIAMPEIVAIFLSKYESDCHARKTELNSIINGIRKEGKDHEDDVAASFSFKEYAGLEIKKLSLTTKVSDEHTVNWEDMTVTCGVEVISTEVKLEGRAIFTRNVTKSIKKTDGTKHNRILADLADRKNQLTAVIQNITDMNRKEREIKGQISAMRLKDAGMDKFVNDPALLELIKVD